MYIGAHLSISKGLAKALEQAREIGGTTLQFFTRNPRGAAAKALDPRDLEKAKKLMAEQAFGPLVGHMSYIINLATPKEDLWELACRVLREDLDRVEAMGVPYLTVHPGSHTGEGVDYGVERIASALNRVLTGEEKATVLLETMAGSGSEVGYTFEQLAAILERVEHKSRVGICADVCHLFGAGYDVRDRLEEVLEEMDRVIGLDKVKAVHLNDSLQPLGSRKDRHACLGQGLIGLEALERIVTHPALAHLPFLLETPGEIEGYRQEIAWVKSVNKE